MKKILIFPLLDSLPSGHHQVADTITEYVNKRSTHIEVKKVDLMNKWNPILEQLVTKTYLWWIQKNPKSYAWIYKKAAYQSGKERSYKHYEILFKKKIKEMINKEKPDLIICTHAFPSYLINHLKKSGECQVPTLNVYTDFFINDVWGQDMIDYHFVSTSSMKQVLMNKQIPEKNIYVTGIPVHESFTDIQRLPKIYQKLNILVSGGSAGLGSIMKLLKQSRPYKQVNFYVLCGNNKRLFREVMNLNVDCIHPLAYISSRQKMDELYNIADAIITKPGGVTISEALKKKVPIFIHSALPGQEEINLNHLLDQGLVFMINQEMDVLEQVLETLNNEEKMKKYNHSLQCFLDNQDLRDPGDIYQFIEFTLSPHTRKIV